MSSEKLMSVAELLTLAHDSWVNKGFIALCSEQERKVSTKTQKPFWKITFVDQAGGAEVKATLFFAPKFGVGQLVELTGQGIKFKNGQYGPEVSVGDKANITMLGAAAHAPERAAAKAESLPAPDGTKFAVNGQTVGMAMKEALALVERSHGGVVEIATLFDAKFWASVKGVASNIIRVARALEAGSLTPDPWAAATQAQPAAMPPSSAPQPKTQGHGGTGHAFPTNGPDEDVPF